MGSPRNLWTASGKIDEEKRRQFLINEWIEDFSESVSQARGSWSNSKQWQEFATQVEALENAWNRAYERNRNPLQDKKVLEAWSGVYQSGKDYERYKMKQKPSEKSRNDKDREKLGLVRLVKQMGENFFQNGSLDAFPTERLADVSLDVSSMVSDLETASYSWRNSDEFKAFRRAANEYELVIKQALAGGGGDLDGAHQRLYDAAHAYLRHKLGRREADAIIGNPIRLEKGFDGVSEHWDKWNPQAKWKVRNAFEVLQGAFSPQGDAKQSEQIETKDITFSGDSSTSAEANEPIELKLDDLSSISEISGRSGDSFDINGIFPESNNLRHPQKSRSIKLEDVERRIDVDKPYRKSSPIRPNGGKGREVPVTKPYQKPRSQDYQDYQRHQR